MDKPLPLTRRYRRPLLWSEQIALGQFVLSVSLKTQKSAVIASPRISNRLAALRQERNISQGELARALKLSDQTLEALEADRYSPTLELAFRCSAFFHLPIETIFHYV